MTRINLIEPKELSTKHLVAEYREITRLPKNLRQSLNRKTKPFSLEEIPKHYVLGKGHVKFFFDKMEFLKKRFESLVDEMLRRGYNPTYKDSSIFNCDEEFMNDYIPTEEALKINKERINERLRGN
jgi:deoxyribonuclease (pyrimidine dimer)